jgi:hypothetical protein
MSYIYPIFYILLLKKWERLRDGLNFKLGPTKHLEIKDEEHYKVKVILIYRMAKNKL